MGMQTLFNLDVISVIVIPILLLVVRVDTVKIGEHVMKIPEEDRKEILALLVIDAVITGFMMPDISMIDLDGVGETLEGLEGFDELFDG